MELLLRSVCLPLMPDKMEITMDKTIKILAIDDEQVILDSIVKLCGAEGWTVDPVISALDGIKKVESQKYDLIVSDIMMPDMDGFEFINKLHSKNIKTPVIITTGFSTVENAVKSLYTGAIDFLPKPFTFDELISNIKRGLKYAELFKRANKIGYDSDAADTSIIYIPCPPRYKRLGYATWSYLEDDGSVKIGLTDLLLRTIDTIENISLNNLDDEIIQGNCCCQIESGDQLVHNILAPISGRIIKRNEQVLQNHTLVEKDPYFEGWLYIIVPANLEYESKQLVPCSSDRL
ncbi:MAG: response regulator [Calditrichaeota bacterium]|nr:response regulator [Calditrichota bacterium]